MIVVAGDWMESEYITINETGWHCSDDAPEEIRKAYEEFMEQINSGVRLTEY